MLAVVLERRIPAEVPGARQFGALREASQGTREQIAPSLARAFEQTFWVAVALVALAFAAAFFLPAEPPEPPDEEVPDRESRDREAALS